MEFYWRACCRQPWPSMAAYRPNAAFSFPNFTVRGCASDASAACECLLVRRKEEWASPLLVCLSLCAGPRS